MPFPDEKSKKILTKPYSLYEELLKKNKNRCKIKKSGRFEKAEKTEKVQKISEKESR